MVLTAEDDRRFMREALGVGHRHLGLTGTNPSVGCVIVADGPEGPVVVGEAVTAESGRPHAETQALAQAGERARGATAYVTLEPCSHHGKTPPCAEALIAAGIGRVVVCVTDPDDRVSGRGLDMLCDAGIDVDTGLLLAEGERALEGYLMRKRNGRPHVTLKLAVSTDGMIGRKGEGQVSITGPASRAEVQKLRAEIDAILVGIGTAIADDPELTCRLPGLEQRSPLRIVLDRELALPLTSKLVRTARIVPVLAIAGSSEQGREFEARRAALEGQGVEIVASDPDNLGDLLAALATRGVSTLLVEGGAAVAQRFLNAGYVDRIQLYTGPGSIGEGGIASPFDRTLVPFGFIPGRTAQYGDDLFEEYERDI